MNKDIKQKIIKLLSQQGVGRKKILKQLGLNSGYREQPPKTENSDGVIGFWHNEYPENLLNTPDFPLLLFSRGDAQLLSKLCISVVGTRDASAYGRQIVDGIFNFTSDQLAIVSGLAYGVDSLVHHRCLEMGITTVAVIAGSVENGYPRYNYKLYKEIVEKGLVIAEFPEGRSAFKGMFPMRNRIIAGLSDITIIVEADFKSGSLITARYALDYGRDVYVVPGSIFNQKSNGTNWLIKQGAGIITSAEDLLHIINTKYDLNLVQSNDAYTINSNTEIKLLGLDELPQEFTFSEVEKVAKLNSIEISRILTKLEVEGILIRSLSGKYIFKKN